MQVWSVSKINGSDFEIRAINFKKQATIFSFLREGVKYIFCFLTLHAPYIAAYTYAPEVTAATSPNDAYLALNAG